MTIQPSEPTSGPARWLRPGFRLSLSTMFLAASFCSAAIALVLTATAERLHSQIAIDRTDLSILFFSIAPVVLVPLGAASALALYIRGRRIQHLTELLLAAAFFAVYMHNLNLDL